MSAATPSPGPRLSLVVEIEMSFERAVSEAALHEEVVLGVLLAAEAMREHPCVAQAKGVKLVHFKTNAVVIPDGKVRVEATVEIDDTEVKVPFDAAAALSEMSDDDLEGIAASGFGACTETDELARIAATDQPEVRALLDRVDGERAVGHSSSFTCSVDKDTFMAFVRAERPHLIKTLAVYIE